MTKAERTRQQILEATAPLFNTKGFDGTSLRDLCDATGLTKGALYGNFGSKEALAVAAFQYAVRAVKRRVVAELMPATTYREKLLALLHFYARYVYEPPVEGGCPLLNTAVEADDHHVTLKRAVAQELESTVAFIASLIEHGKAAGEFKATADSRAHAFLFFCAIEGAIMFSRVSPSDEAMRTVVQQCEIIVDQIANQPK